MSTTEVSFIGHDLGTTSGAQNFLNLVQTGLAEGRVEPTIYALRELVRSKPENLLPYSILLQIGSATQNDSIIQEVVNIAVTLPFGSESLVAECGIALLSLNRTEQAEQAFALVLGRAPDNTQALIGLGQVMLTRGDFARAFRHFTYVARVFPDSYDALTGLTHAAVAVGDGNVALATLSKMRKINSSDPRYRTLSEAIYKALPTNAEALLCHAMALHDAHDYQGALSFAEKAVESDPYCKEAYFLSASIQYLAGNFQGMLQASVKAYQSQKHKARLLRLDSLNIRILDEIFTGPIGHISQITTYVKMVELGMLAPAKTFVFTGDYCGNKHYLKYFSPWLDFLETTEEREVYRTIKPYVEQGLGCFELVDGSYLHIYPAQAIVQNNWEKSGRPPILSLHERDRQRGWDYLEARGVPRGSWFVTLHVRDTGVNESGEWLLPQRAARNAHIATYLAAVKWLTEQGAWVIRIGDSKMQPMPSLPGVIDLTRVPDHEEYLDVFLLSECTFMIGTPSGPSFVPSGFGKPVVNTNWNSLAILPPPSMDLFIPKLIWSEREERFLSFAEQVVDPKVNTSESLELLRSIGLKQVDNSSEEILAVVQEMTNRCQGKLVYTHEDNADHQAFRDSLKADVSFGGARLGRDFLRAHKALLYQG